MAERPGEPGGLLEGALGTRRVTGRLARHSQAQQGLLLEVVRLWTAGDEALVGSGGCGRVWLPGQRMAFVQGRQAAIRRAAVVALQAGERLGGLRPT